MATLSSGQTKLGRYGDGGDGNRPERSRWVILRNNTGSTMFIPENTSAERESVYAKWPSRYSADPAYGVTGNKRFYSNTAVMGNGPCWNNHSNSANYKTPSGCPSGYTDEGVVNQNSTRPNLENGVTGVLHGDIPWMFYFEKDYGCSGNTYAKISVRRCYRTATQLGYT